MSDKGKSTIDEQRDAMTNEPIILNVDDGEVRRNQVPGRNHATPYNEGNPWEKYISDFNRRLAVN